MKVYVIYASMNGHTEFLGRAVADGAQAANRNATVVFKSADDVEAEELKIADVIIWGSSGYFGVPNPKMSGLLAKLGGLWFTGALQGKVGGVFGTTSSPHGGLETLLRNLQLPMQHLGMTVIAHTGPLNPERLQYGCPYGVGAVIPVEESKDAPMNKPSEAELNLAHDYGSFILKKAEQGLVAIH